MFGSAAVAGALLLPVEAADESVGPVLGASFTCVGGNGGAAALLAPLAGGARSLPISGMELSSLAWAGGGARAGVGAAAALLPAG